MKLIEKYLEDVKTTIDQIPVERIDEIIGILQDARVNHKQVFIMGNGGSASTASHFVCDLAKNTRKTGWPGFRAIGLTDNMAIFSAYGNDEGYENVFAQQLNNLLQPGDVVIAISGSGNSPNVIKAVELANSRGAITVGFTGLTGGKLKATAQYVIYVPNYKIDQVEDIHLMLEHIICRALMEIEEPAPQKPEVVEVVDTSLETDELVKQLFGKATKPLIRKTGSLGAANPEHAELLSKISQEFANKFDLHDLLARLLCLTVESVGAVGGSIVVLDENGEVVDGALAYGGEIQQQTPDRLNETVHHGLAGWVLENRRPALVENTKEDPRWLPRGWEATLDLSRSAICVPLLTQDRVIGVLTLTRLQTNRFTMEDLSLLTSITLALSYSVTAKSSAARRNNGNGQ
jgi:D-sedoheptulose 7-phosphate isomerase